MGRSEKGWGGGGGVGRLIVLSYGVKRISRFDQLGVRGGEE